MRKIRVLIADDHTLFRESLRTLINNHDDIEVVGEAANGEEAIAMTERLKPDIVLMDIAMPDINGLIATGRLKKEHPSAKVLILSMYDADQFVFEALRAGASGYILKKAPATDLINGIRAVYQGEAFLCPTVTRKVIDNWREKIEDKSDKEDFQSSLTARELEILSLIAEGKSNKEIAKFLKISVRTVQTHRLNLMKKLKVHDRTQLVRIAIKKGLIVP